MLKREGKREKRGDSSGRVRAFRGAQWQKALVLRENARSAASGVGNGVGVMSCWL